MPFLQLSPKSEYQSLGEAVSQFYHHSQGGSLLEFKQHCYQLLNEMIPLDQCFWVVEQGEEPFSLLSYESSQHPINLPVKDHLAKHWSTLKLEFSLEELAVNTNTTFKNVFRTDFLVGSWFLEAQGVTHYFGFSPQAEHTSFSAEQLKQLNSLIPHLMESFRLHCLAKHRLSLNSPNFYFGIFQNSGRSIEVDKEFAPLVANYKTSLVKLVKAMKAGEIRFVHLKEQEISFFLRLEAVLDVVFCQAISLPIELEVLTNKELEVCFHLKQMLGNQQIAENMAISPKTVENHLANIYEKLDGVSRSGLIVKLLKQ